MVCLWFCSVEVKKKFMQTGCEMLRQASVIINAAVYCVPGGPMSQLTHYTANSMYLKIFALTKQTGLTRRMNSTPVS